MIEYGKLKRLIFFSYVELSIFFAGQTPMKENINPYISKDLRSFYFFFLLSLSSNSCGLCSFSFALYMYPYQNHTPSDSIIIDVLDKFTVKLL